MHDRAGFPKTKPGTDFTEASSNMGNIGGHLMLLIFGALDLVAIGGMVTLSITSGISPDAIGFRRDREPVNFWLSVSSVILLGSGIFAVVAKGIF